MLSAAWFLVAARRLNVAEFGDLALLLSLSLMGASIADAGLSWKVAQGVAAVPADGRAILRSAAWIRVRIALGVASVVVVAFHATATTRSIGVPLLIVPSIVATALYTTWLAGLRSVGAAWMDATNEVVSRAAMLGLGLLLVTPEKGLVSVVALYSALDLASTAVLWLAVRHRFPAVSPHTQVASFGGRQMVELGVAVAIGVVYLRADTWILSALSGATDLADYGAAYRLVDGLLLPASAMAALVVPTLVAERPERVRRTIFRLSAMTVAVIAGPLLLVSLAAPAVLGLLFGDPYRGATGPLRLLAAGAIPAALIYLAMPVVGLRDRRKLAAVFGGGLVLNVAGNLVFVPHLGASGAALATLVSHLIVAGFLVAQAARVAGSLPAQETSAVAATR